MAGLPDTEIQAKLVAAQNIWFASVRPDGRPHLVPVWFVWHAGKIFISTEAGSVKSHNLQHNPKVALALEDGQNPVICEGRAAHIMPPYSADLLAAFFQKYAWDVPADAQYNQVIEVVPAKWLAW